MNNSSIIGKISITGNLVLKSPLLIGDGEGETNKNFLDTHVLKNDSGKPFIPGTSLCGVLREWLTNINPDAVPKLFGDPDDMQSSIQIEDIELANGEIFSRDGVRIDGLTGTGVTGGKYDFEFVERGASGKLNMLINLRGVHADEKNSSPEKIVAVVKMLLKKLSDGIRLGALTSKGFGLAKVENLTANIYDFRKKSDVAAWFLEKDSSCKLLPSTKDFPATNDLVVDAQFNFNSSFIVRDYEVNAADRSKKVSAVTMKSCGDFVIPGTSLKGILRHRAEYIFAKLGLNKNLLDNLMGTTTSKSRFGVSESYVSAEKNFAEVNHTRNKIDRLTGGTLQGTLFTTKPVYQKNFDKSTLTIHFEIRNANDSEVGLAIFLLRDLWFGRVAVGGEKSVGRGTLKGLSAEIKFDGKTYKLDADGKVIVGDKTELENFAAALKNFVGGDDK